MAGKSSSTQRGSFFSFNKSVWLDYRSNVRLACLAMISLSLLLSLAVISANYLFQLNIYESYHFANQYALAIHLSTIAFALAAILQLVKSRSIRLSMSKVESTFSSSSLNDLHENMNQNFPLMSKYVCTPGNRLLDFSSKLLFLVGALIFSFVLSMAYKIRGGTTVYFVTRLGIVIFYVVLFLLTNFLSVSKYNLMFFCSFLLVQSMAIQYFDSSRANIIYIFNANNLEDFIPILKANLVAFLYVMNEVHIFIFVAVLVVDRYDFGRKNSKTFLSHLKLIDDEALSVKRFLDDAKEYCHAKDTEESENELSLRRNVLLSSYRRVKIHKVFTSKFLSELLPPSLFAIVNGVGKK